MTKKIKQNTSKENSIATMIMIININFLFIPETNITIARSRKKGNKNKYIS